MEAYSMDLRLRVLRACDEGTLTRAEIAEQFEVSQSWLYSLLKRRREEGTIAPRPYAGGPKPTFDERGLERLGKEVQKHPDATLAELQQTLSLECCLTTIWSALNTLGLTYKKDGSGRRAKSA